MTSLNANLYSTVVSWDDIETVDVRPGVRRKLYSTDQVMFAWHSLDVGMQINPHSHADFDQLVFIAEGVCDYHVGGVAHRMTAGSFMLVPAGAEHHVVPVEGPCINIDVFTPPREDFLQQM